MSVNWSQYTTIEQLENDVKSIKIQGATNVALAVVRGMEIVTQSFSYEPNIFLKNVVDVGNKLARARTNEPLARNAVKHLEVKFKTEGYSSTSVSDMVKAVSQINSQYLNLVERGKEKMVGVVDTLDPITNAFTHCHSSTVEKILVNLSKKNENFKVACSETRPLFQGRITATNLLNANVNTSMITDSGAPSFVADRSFFPIDVVFIGADEISIHGDVINKIGSFGIALGAYYSSTPLYVVASLLKMNPDSAYKTSEIEMRSPYEIWENPPQGLSIFNPAFEVVPNKMITGYITEAGIIKPEDMARTLHETYDWVF